MDFKAFINTLTEQEKVMHKELIDECLKREEELKAANLKEQIKKLYAFNMSMDAFNKKVDELNVVIKTLNREIENYYNETAPDENYYEGLLQ